MKVKLLSYNIPENEELYDMGTVTFYVQGLSRVALAQLVRHRTFSFSVQSMRYVKQNGNFVTPMQLNDIEWYDDITKAMFAEYHSLLEDGYKKEDARYVLPLATTTNLVVTIPLMFAQNFFELRLHKSAQPEIRALAALMFKETYNLLNDFFSDNVVDLWSEALTKEEVVYYFQGDKDE